MLEIHYWEDDPEAEWLFKMLKKSNIEFTADPLDPAIGNARPYADYNGKVYWDFDELTRELID